MIFEITDARHVPGKLADAAIRFEPGEPLDGFTLHGFQIWAPRDGNPDPNVTFPARSWTPAGGKPKTVVLLKDARTDSWTDAPESIALKAGILAQYQAEYGYRPARRGALVRAGQRAAAAPIAPPAGTSRVLRPRVAEPVGTIRHRIADAVAP